MALLTRLVSAATTNATLVAASASGTPASNRKLCGYLITNLAAASLRYVKFYNKATAPTVGTDVPILTVPVPAVAGSFAQATFPSPIVCDLGLAFATTLSITDADNTAVAAGDLAVQVFWE